MSVTSQHEELTTNDGVTAQSALVIRFRGDPERLQSTFLPPALEPVGDGDTGWAIVSRTILPTMYRPREDPRLPTKLTEAAVAIPARYESEQYTFSPLTFFDRHSPGFRRGIVRGIGSIEKTKWHVACPTRSSIEPGQALAGTATHRGQSVLSATLDIERETSADEAFPDGFFDFAHYRHLPDPLAGEESDGLVADVTSMHCPAFSVGSVWEGPTTLEFGQWNDGVLADLVEEVLGGYHATFGFTYEGERTLAPASGTWGDHLE
ncbi:acetoacetate decarboxylase family protein [Halovivax limisalsi]|uniref:acetoacetate decarboxylase family protein n=1 Tax=Halovivax limisalsi TaxID=1453760 RepID=UPI001FFD6861|nr:acetoacetate decarboxylase family protein [Halovivax limisalsi]